MPSTLFGGIGDATIDVQRAREPALVRIAGNAAGQPFCISSYGPDGKLTGILVSRLEPYEGTCPIDFLETEHTTRFTVAATGPWQIEILPLTPDLVRARTLIVPGQREGCGDDVIFIGGAPPGRMRVSGNPGEHLFSITAYDNQRTLLLNTTLPYRGIIALAPNTQILAVRAHGPWELSIFPASDSAASPHSTAR